MCACVVVVVVVVVVVLVVVVVVRVINTLIHTGHLVILASFCNLILKPKLK